MLALGVDMLHPVLAPRVPIYWTRLWAVPMALSR
jgi:hypothetical protein